MATRQERREGRTGSRRDTAAPLSSEQKLEDSTCEDSMWERGRRRDRELTSKQPSHLELGEGCVEWAAAQRPGFGVTYGM